MTQFCLSWFNFVSHDSILSPVLFAFVSVIQFCLPICLPWLPVIVSHSHCLPKSFAMCPETSDWLLGCNLPWLFTCHPHDVTTCSSDVRYDIKKSKWDTNLEITAILISFPGTHLFDWLTPNQNIYVYILDRYNHVRWHPSPHPIPPFFVKKVSENSLTQHLSKCFKHPDNRTKLTVYSRPPSIVSLLET